MLKNLSKISDYLNSSNIKTKNDERDCLFFRIVEKLYPNLNEISIMALLTPEFQKRFFDYAEQAQELSESTIRLRTASLRSIARDLIRDGHLPNLPIFPSTKRDKEILGDRKFRRDYDQQIQRLLSLYISKGATVNAIKDMPGEEIRYCHLTREHALIGYALLSILINGIGLEALANIKTADYDPQASTLALPNGITMKLPASVAAIITDLRDTKRTYLLNIIKPTDSEKRKAEKIDLLKRDLNQLLLKNQIELPVGDEPLYIYSSMAIEAGCDPELVRTLISSAVTGGGYLVDYQLVSNATSTIAHSVAARYSDVVQSWFCIMCNHPGRTFVKSRIRENKLCPRDVEFLEPTDILFRQEERRTVPYENPFFQPMLLIKCKFYEVKAIANSVRMFGYLYGYTDAEGEFHCRISQAEIDNLNTYLNLSSRRKSEFIDGADCTGQKVILLSNPFKGAIGTIISQDEKHKKFHVAVEIFSGAFVNVSYSKVMPMP